MQRDDAEGLVASFLRANPGWLAAHPELYVTLEPPRRIHGDRLADHMAAMLDQARRRGSGDAADRRAAEGFAGRVQEAAIALFRARDVAWCLQHDVPGLLQLDSVRLCVEADLPGALRMPAGTVAATLGHRDAVVRDTGPRRAWHGEAAPLARKEAIVRVPLVGSGALLALACRDGSGFLGAGTQALAFLGRAAAAALERA